MSLKAHPRFDWSKLKWGAPQDQMSDDCSYCGAPIAEDACPLRMWKPDGSAAVLCDDCCSDSFGLKTFPPEPHR